MTDAVEPIVQPLGEMQASATRLADLAVVLDYHGRRLQEYSTPRADFEAEARQHYTAFLVLLSEVKRLTREHEVWLAAHEAAE